ncbi:response regulator [Burkholderia thailandensis]|uniref:DNA-binding response regulator, putative n=1 Tax=Burkholderia thailandensis (strain ATCC 700388 / DSM 13276 / CCUG 48851 / CIP 106301 / E264) TaxID=271848 RepID=Q2T5V8_BURTA|nr:response regulator transcription factor [Burkholderia thailandensis]ABC34852.1 DNA-binding response regulator,  putative [Burkholderia thailandensis E264]AHI74962.1 response regulator [Burkholderia thailandensis 2002721723]AHI82079.1 response regulator [Burkholderia thailandensis E444]AIC89521.1 response regulator [Burkholderia thailandensis USAMRU Malaysia \
MDAREPTPPLRVFLVDHAAPVRDRLTSLLETIVGVAVVGEAEDVPAALAGILETGADVAVIELRLTGGSGLELISALTRAAPRVVKIVLTNLSGAAFRAACSEAGADFFFDKTADVDAACRTVRTLASAHRPSAAE